MKNCQNRLKFIYYYLIIINSIFNLVSECKRDACCEVINIISTSFLSKFHPEHLGSYRLMKNSKHVFKSLTEPMSYIYLLNLEKGKVALKLIPMTGIRGYGQTQWRNNFEFPAIIDLVVIFCSKHLGHQICNCAL